MLKIYIKEWSQTHIPPLTGKELAAKVGTSEANISNISNGKQWPEKNRLEAIAKILGINPSDLFRSPEEANGSKKNDGITCPQCGHRIKLKAE